MNRRLIMGLLALGTVTGYASGFAHLACAHHHWREHQRAEFVRQVAQACTEAAQPGGGRAVNTVQVAPDSATASTKTDAVPRVVVGPFAPVGAAR